MPRLLLSYCDAVAAPYGKHRGGLIARALSQPGRESIFTTVLCINSCSHYQLHRERLSHNVVCCAALAAGIPGGQGDLELVEVGVRCSLEQMLEEGFYHSDPHPGNLLHTQSGELAYIDFGEQRLRRPSHLGHELQGSLSLRHCLMAFSCGSGMMGYIEPAIRRCATFA